jgi:predicted neuraminidase
MATAETTRPEPGRWLQFGKPHIRSMDFRDRDGVRRIEVELNMDRWSALAQPTLAEAEAFHAQLGEVIRRGRIFEEMDAEQRDGGQR